MALTPAIREGGGGRLGLWVAVPILGAVVLIAVATQLSRSACGAGPGEDAAGVVFIVLTGLAVAATFAVAVWRTVLLVRRGGRDLGRTARLVAALVLLSAVAAFAYLLGGATTTLAVLILAALIIGFVVTVTALIWLVSTVPDRVEADDVGVEPAYLFGFSLFVYPFVFLAATVVAYGCYPT